jgi:hypothetical protein
VEHDEQKGHLGRRRVEAEEFFGDYDVGGAGDGEQFGEALNDSQKNDFENGHVVSLCGGRDWSRK